MELIDLSNGLLTGIADVDRQHGELADALDAVLKLQASGADAAALDMALADFRDRVHAHFAWEQDYLEARKSPRLDSHTTLHEILLGQLDEMIAELRANRYAFLAEAMERRFVPWLVEHIANVDKKMAN